MVLTTSVPNLVFWFQTPAGHRYRWILPAYPDDSFAYSGTVAAGRARKPAAPVEIHGVTASGVFVPPYLLVGSGGTRDARKIDFRLGALATGILALIHPYALAMLFVYAVIITITRKGTGKHWDFCPRPAARTGVAACYDVAHTAA